MDDAIIFSKCEQHFEDLANLYKDLTKCGLQHNFTNANFAEIPNLHGSHVYVERKKTIIYTYKRKI